MAQGKQEHIHTRTYISNGLSARGPERPADLRGHRGFADLSTMFSSSIILSSDHTVMRLDDSCPPMVRISFHTQDFSGSSCKLVGYTVAGPNTSPIRVLSTHIEGFLGTDPRCRIVILTALHSPHHRISMSGVPHSVDPRVNVTMLITHRGLTERAWSYSHRVVWSQNDVL